MKDKYKKILISAGVISMISTFIMWSWVFLSAYFNPAKQVIIDINYYGEANFEVFILFIMILIVPFTIYYLFLMIKEKFNYN